MSEISWDNNYSENKVICNIHAGQTTSSVWTESLILLTFIRLVYDFSSLVENPKIDEAQFKFQTLHPQHNLIKSVLIKLFSLFCSAILLFYKEEFKI